MRALFFINFLSIISVFSFYVNAYSLEIKGDYLVYDATKNIYWTKDANIGGLMTWGDAQGWIKRLNKECYGGYNDWRLPFTPNGYSDDGTWVYDKDNNLTKYNVTVSELGHLFYQSLQLQGLYSSDGTVNTDYGLRGKETLFDNLQSGYYWFGTPSKIDDDPAVWLFDFEFGIQFKNTLGTDRAYAIAVRSTTPVPEPSSAILFLIGVLSLSRVRSRQNN